MNSIEFTRWRAFDRIYPPAEVRIDIAAAIVAGAMTRSDPGEFITDYAAKYRQTQNETTEEDEIEQINAMFRAMIPPATPPTTNGQENHD